MSILFRRIRGRAAGHVVVVNALNVMTIEPTSWGGSEINFSDVYAVASRDTPHVVQQLLEGRMKLCETPLCDRYAAGQYEPVCTMCRDRKPADRKAYVATPERDVQELVIVGGRHGFA